MVNHSISHGVFQVAISCIHTMLIQPSCAATWFPSCWVNITPIKDMKTISWGMVSGIVLAINHKFMINDLYNPYKPQKKSYWCGQNNAINPPITINRWYSSIPKWVMNRLMAIALGMQSNTLDYGTYGYIWHIVGMVSICVGKLLFLYVPAVGSTVSFANHHEVAERAWRHWILAGFSSLQ